MYQLQITTDIENGQIEGQNLLEQQQYQDLQDDSQQNSIKQKYKKQVQEIYFYLYFLISAIILTISLVSLKEAPVRDYLYNTNVDIKIAESIPNELNYTTQYNTSQAWVDIINNSTDNIKIIAYYSTMFCQSADGYECPTDGDDVINALSQASQRGVNVEMIIDATTTIYNDTEIERLQNAITTLQVRYINVGGLFGAGIQHAKVIIGDDKYFYVGSANFDWRALTYVKELGLVVNDKILCSDMVAIYNQYRLLSTEGRHDDPKQIKAFQDQEYLSDESVQAKFNINNSATVNESQTFIGISPPAIVTSTRTHDIDAAIKMINEAKSYIKLETMDYSQTSQYSSPKFFDTELTPALINAAMRKVNVSILLQYKTGSTLDSQLDMLKSYKINVYFINMPQIPSPVPSGWDHTYLTHSKFIVADDKDSFVTTSNFEPDYFTNTFGISYVLYDNENIAKQLSDIFDRDATSNCSEKY